MISRRSYNSDENTCAYDIITLTDIILNAISLLIILFTSFWWFKSSKRHESVRNILPWCTYGLILISFLISCVLVITRAVVIACNQEPHIDARGLMISSFIFYHMYRLLTLGVFAYTLVVQNFKLQSRSLRIPESVNGGLVALVTLIWLPIAGIFFWIWTQDRHSLLRSDNFQAIAKAYNKITETYYILYLIASVVASGFLIYTLFSGSSLQSRTKAKVWTTITSITFVSVNIVSVLSYYLIEAADSRINVVQGVIFQIFFTVFMAFTIFGLLMSVQHSSSPQIINMDTNDGETKRTDQFV